MLFLEVFGMQQRLQHISFHEAGFYSPQRKLQLLEYLQASNNQE
jgi:hypothetical protein